MPKLHVSLIGIVLACAFVESSIIPALWTPLRVDLVLGMVVGVAVHLAFSQGLFFVMLSSVLLEAFSGARLGLIPLFYLFAFVSLQFIKDLIYLENILTQAGLASLFFGLGVLGSLYLLDVPPPSHEVVPLITGCILSGCACPFMVELVARVKGVYGT